MGAMLSTVGGQFSRVSEATFGHGAVWNEGGALVWEVGGEEFLGEEGDLSFFYLFIFSFLSFFRVRGVGDWGGRCGRASA